MQSCSARSCNLARTHSSATPSGTNVRVETLGVRCGYKGLLETNFAILSARDVGGIIQQGGTILGSGRCDEFETPDGIQKAVSLLKAHGIDGLIVIGGSGSQAGAAALAAQGCRVVGIPSTIDNDLCGTDISNQSVSTPR